MVRLSQMKLLSIEHQYLRACATLFISVFNSPPWNEKWSQDVALKRLEDCFNTPGAYGVVAIVEDEVFGFAIGVVAQYDQNENFYLKEICVDSTKQRSGIGTKMMDALHHDLIRKGVGMVYLLTIRDSPAAAFYEKCGFLNSSKMIMMSKSTKI
jgi:aminoglycoside 6'-N-acetyltransferase I